VVAPSRTQIAIASGLAAAIRASLTGRTPRDIAREPSLILRAAGRDPDEWQESVISSTARRIAIIGSRQVGKTAGMAAKALADCIGGWVRGKPRWWYFGGPSERQSKLLIEKAAELARSDRLGLIGKGCPIERKDDIQKTCINFADGGLMQALPSNESTIRGNSAHGIIVTEAALTRDSLFSALTPYLATTNGTLIYESTPFGQRGRFWEIVEDVNGKRAGWTVFRRHYSECTRITAEFMERERREKSPLDFAQEYELVFHAAVGSLFSADQIAAAFENGERPTFPADARWVDQRLVLPPAEVDEPLTFERG